MGQVYVGTPDSQPVTVVFDTGSEYLAITSSLCDDSSSGDFKFKKFDQDANQFVQKNGTVTEERCKSKAYNMGQSATNQVLSKQSSKLTYGSAKLQGFIWEDYVCIQPLNLQSDSTVDLQL